MPTTAWWASGLYNTYAASASATFSSGAGSPHRLPDGQRVLQSWQAFCRRIKVPFPEDAQLCHWRHHFFFRQTSPYDFWIGCIFILVALCVTGWTLHSYTQHNTVPGWSSLMISVWLVGGVILVSLGIVGEYIGKIYIEVKDRPRYNEEEPLMPSGKTE